MSKSKLESLLSAAIMVVAGICLFLFPGGTLNVTVRLLGIAALVYGALGVVSYLRHRDEGPSTVKLIVHAAATIVGLAIAANPAFLISFFPVLGGVLIALSGVDSLMTALNWKRAGNDTWKPLLILSVVTIALGILIFANPFATMDILIRVFAVILVYDGLVGVFSAVKA